MPAPMPPPTALPLDLYGATPAWRAALAELRLPGAQLARLVAEQRGSYVAVADDGTWTTPLAPGLRRALAGDGGARPAVGDFVGMVDEGGGHRRVAAVLARTSCIARKEAGRAQRVQVVAANVDVALLVTALGGELNVRRLERLVAIVHEGGCRAAIVVNKADLVAPDAGRAALAALPFGPDIPRVLVSMRQGPAAAVAALAPLAGPGRTLALLGSSGVGKTTLLNGLLGGERFATGGLSAAGQGRHTTRTRQLVPLAGGGAVIDTPGMREIGVLAADAGIAEAFADVVALASRCRFGDCRHGREPGCAVRDAVATGALAAGRLDAWERLRQEAAGAVQFRRPRRGGRG